MSAAVYPNGLSIPSVFRGPSRAELGAEAGLRGLRRGGIVASLNPSKIAPSFGAASFQLSDLSRYDT